MAELAATAFGLVPSSFLPELPTDAKRQRNIMVVTQAKALYTTIKTVLIPKFKEMHAVCQIPINILEQQLEIMMKDILNEEKAGWASRGMKNIYISSYTDKLIQQMQDINRSLLLVNTLLELKDRGYDVQCNIPVIAATALSV